MDRPAYWKTTLSEIEEAVGRIRRGAASVLCRSAGGRDVALVEYGSREDLRTQANYNSACGAGNPAYYADKSGVEKPVILIVGGIHGSEMEGIAATVNLIHALETGRDLSGREYPRLERARERFRWLLIPCMNPDGRSRMPDTVWGMDCEQYIYYAQGTWKDGSLCRWPGCKAVHPIKEKAGFLGGYFNDDGVNLMHDNFFLPMARETKSLLALAEREAPDCAMLLHGGLSSKSHILQPTFVPLSVKQKVYELGRRMEEAGRREGLPFEAQEISDRENDIPPPSFNLASAIHHICGAVCAVYESNQGVADPRCQYTYEQLLRQHMLFFEKLISMLE